MSLRRKAAGSARVVARAASTARPAARSAAQPLRATAPLFAALGDETRLRIVTALCAGGLLSIAHLTAGTEITRQAVTKHLHVLAKAGLVRDVKVGRERLWEFEPERLAEAQRALEAIGRQWDSALERLRLAVEG